MKRLRAYIDSQLVSGHINGEFEARDPVMARYLAKVKSLTPSLAHFSISYIPRSENARADILSRLATSTNSVPDSGYLKHMERPSIEPQAETLPVAQESSWMDPYIQYIANGTLPAGRE